jgi:glucokinase
VIGSGSNSFSESILIKNSSDGLYQPLKSAGGNTDFIVKSEEDWELVKFAKDYLENSLDKTELKKLNGRVQAQHLCSGNGIVIL